MFTDLQNEISLYAKVFGRAATQQTRLVPGTEKRIPITFEEPKQFDGTPQQAGKYRERSLQIATDLYYVFSQINT